jgi:hypothetical protein
VVSLILLLLPFWGLIWPLLEEAVIRKSVLLRRRSVYYKVPKAHFSSSRSLSSPVVKKSQSSTRICNCEIHRCDWIRNRCSVISAFYCIRSGRFILRRRLRQAGKRKFLSFQNLVFFCRCLVPSERACSKPWDPIECPVIIIPLPFWSTSEKRYQEGRVW